VSGVLDDFARHSSLATVFMVKDGDGRLLAFGANL
jgi:hypothetical protein